MQSVQFLHMCPNTANGAFKKMYKLCKIKLFKWKWSQPRNEITLLEHSLSMPCSELYFMQNGIF